MKLNKLNAGVAGCVLAVALSGCDKESANKTTDDVKKSADNAASAIQQGADKAAAEVKPVAEKAVAEVKQTTEKAATVVAEPAKAPDNGVSSVITKAQNLVAEKKYQEALTSLAGLKDAKLTDSQQKIVDELKAQIQKLMSGDAGKAIGNLLGK